MFAARSASTFLAAVLFAVPVFADPIAYPGSHWVIAQKGAGFGTDSDNALLQGKIEQGVDWARIGNSAWRFNTYAAMGYTMDNTGVPYNNKVLPAVGVKLVQSRNGSSLEVGIQIGADYRWRSTSRDTYTGATVYVSAWNGWNLRD